MNHPMHWDVNVSMVSVNDTFVEIIEWYVPDEAHVEEGTLLCLVESSKASVEIASEHSGYVKILAAPGQQVAIGHALCRVYRSLDALRGGTTKWKPAAKEQKGVDATDKAIALAQRLGIDLSLIGKQGVIREKDVLAFCKTQEGLSRPPAEDLMQFAAADPHEKKSAPIPPGGIVEKPRYLEVLQRVLAPPLFGVMWVLSRIPILSAIVETMVRVYPVGLVGSALRYTYYRNKLGYMGEKVRIDTGSLFEGMGAIEIGDRSHIDTNVKIVARTPEQPVRIGRGVHIGAGAVIYGTGGISIGDYTAIAAGSCVYSARSLPEDPSRPGRLISMSHAAPRDEQYVVWEKVTIEDYVFIGLNAVLLPGVTVGKAAIVNSGTVVANDVPEKAIVGGSRSSVIGRRNVG